MDKQDKAISTAIANVNAGQLNTINEQTDMFFNALVIEPKKDVSVLPEEIFVSYFLPYFIGDKQIGPTDRIIAEWYSIAGAPGKAVNILEGNGVSGKVIFTVPPLFDTSIINSNSKVPSEALSNIFAVYEMHKRNLATSGNNYLLNKLADKKASSITVSTEFTDNQKAWMYIFDRYKLKDKVTNVIGNQADRLTDDDIIYD